jgi:ribosomal protein L7Ae-like RNA K-turn-binding protein
MNEKSAALLGLARKAGKVAAGDSQVEAILAKGKGFLLVLATDAVRAQRKYTPVAARLGLPVVAFADKEELGKVLGMSPKAVVLVTDSGFAGALQAAQST